MGSSVILPVPGQPKTGADPGFTSGSVGNLVSFGFAGVSPPSTLYIQRDDVLTVELISSQAAEVVTLTIRLLLPFQSFGGQPDAGKPAGAVTVPIIGPGTIVQGQQTVASSGLRIASLKSFALLEGYLLSVGFSANLTGTRGASFVRAWLNRGPVTSTTPNAALVLVEDYITTNHPVSWPGGRQLFPTEGPGNLQTITRANPAAGADWTISVPTSARWRIQSFSAQLLTSGVAGNRIVRSRISDLAGNLLWQGPPSAVIPASSTVQVSAAPGQFTSTTDPATVSLPLPSPTILPQTGVFGVNTVGLLGGDQWSVIAAQIEENLDIT